jgi:hypothetical protein
MVSDAFAAGAAADAFGDLVEFGNEERAWPGDVDGRGSGVGRVERRDRVEVAVDECSFEPFCAARGARSVWPEPRAALARPSECLGDHDVDRDAPRDSARRPDVVWG